MSVDVPLSPWKRNFDFEGDPPSPYVFERYDASGLVRVAAGGATALRAIQTMLDLDGRILAGSIAPVEGGLFRLEGHPTIAEMFLSRDALEILDKARAAYAEDGYDYHIFSASARDLARELEASGAATLDETMSPDLITVRAVCWEEP